METIEINENQLCIAIFEYIKFLAATVVFRNSQTSVSMEI